ncbi:MAG TPA: DUF6603 domain-containing protein [Pyrinomonadaceae bacterium]|nr:DUF6603 domain-containing protein [Pyrinomonadaceae bacterium]
MEINRLEEIVRGALDSEGKFALPTGALESAAADRISADFLPDNELRVDGASVVRPETEDTITVRGTGVDLPFKGMAVELLFYIKGGAVAFSLTATGDASWRLPKGFPLFAGTLAEHLRFASIEPHHPPQLFLRTHQARGEPRSDLSFKGVLDLNAMTGGLGLASLVGNPFLPISGPIVLKEKGSQFHNIDLVALVSSSVDLRIAKVEKLTFKVGSQLYAYSPTQKYATPFIELGAKIPFQTKSGPHTIPISARATNLDSGFRFQADLSAIIDTAIEELASLTNGHGMGDILPNDFRLADTLEFNEFFFDFNPTAEKKVTFIGMGVHSKRPWPILHIEETKKDLVVEDVELMFTLGDPFGTAYKSLTISGAFAIADGGARIIEASMAYPGWVIQASLKEDTTLALRDAVGLFKKDTDRVPAMQVDQLELVVSPEGFTFNLDVEGELLIPDTLFGIERVGVSIEKTSSHSAFSFNGVLLLAGALVAVSAEYPGDGASWQFEGSTGPGQQIPIGHVIGDLAQKFGDLNMPSAIDSLVIENLSTTFNTGSREFTFGCAGKFRADDTDVKMKVDLAVKGSGETYSRTITGKLWVGVHEFDLHFVRQGSSNSLVATYRPPSTGRSLNVKQLVGSISSGVANYVPSDLQIELKDVIFAYSKGTTQDGSKLVFGLAIGTGINLSNLPLVGQKLPPEATVAVDNLQILFNSKGLTGAEVKNFNSLIPDGVTKLPAPESADEQAAPRLLAGTSTTDVLTAEPVVIENGFVVSALMNFGGSKRFFCLSGVRRKSSLRTGVDVVTGPDDAMMANAPAADNVKWFPVQKSFGPVFFDKVGVQYEAATIRFLMNAALSAAGLTLTLEGLSLGSPITKFAPEFELQGLGIDYKNDAVEIGGAFRRTDKKTYDGAAVLKTKQFAVSAIGSYTTTEDGEPSLFIYAFLDYPLGGPAFFFVKGLAAGFGYNRRLIAPSIDKVAEFPLVTQADGRSDKPQSVMEALTALRSYVPPSVGSIFLAVGVKFNSFKLVDSFALLTMEFGNNFAINLLGVSKAVIPTPETGKAVTPLAQVEIAWKATFNPDDGCLAIDARLTPNSYILSKDCHLTGGYAFYSWFSGPHAGDFVQTLGGYHPEFQVPDHYPKVPRLAFDWRVSSSLTIQGEAYYALTGSALMAGGRLEVLFREGELRAWLKVGANFLIAWKPYHYDASLHVNVGASYTFNLDLLFTSVRVTISVDVGAQLHLWGPDFSGTARIDLSVISFTISFGAGASQTPPPLKEWSTFAESFLPEKDVCSISVKDGLVRNIQADGKVRWVINPKEFSLVVDSAIPFKSASTVGGNLSPLANMNFGVRPMAVTKDELDSTLTVTIEKHGVGVNDKFKHSLIKKLVPAALWESVKVDATGKRLLEVDVNAEKFLKDVPAGIEITPRAQPKGGQTSKIHLKVFEYSDAFYPVGEEKPKGHAYEWQPASAFKPLPQVEALPTFEEIRQARIGEIRKTVASNQRRAALLAGLGMTFAVNIDGKVADDFLSAPQVGTVNLWEPK